MQVQSLPFMVKERDKREELLRKPPQLSLFAAYAYAFADTYSRLRTKEFIAPELIGKAKAAQQFHGQWMQRLRKAHERGYEALPVGLQTASEVLAQADPGDPEVARAMVERQALQAIARAMR